MNISYLSFLPSSLGLAIPPRIRFLKREEKRQTEREAQKKASLERLKQAAEEDVNFSGSEEYSSEENEYDSLSDNETKLKKTAVIKHVDAPDSSESESESRDLRTNENDNKLNFDLNDDNDDLFTLKRTILPDSDSENEKGDKSVKKEKEKKTQTKYALAKTLQKKNVKVNTKLTFDEEGKVTITFIYKYRIFKNENGNIYVKNAECVISKMSNIYL